jgi:alkane 1-monooxygenase
MRVHHKLAGLPEDPGTPGLDDNIWVNYYNNLKGSVRAAWNVEVKRLQGNAWTLKNRMIPFEILHLCILGALYYAGGWKAVVFQIVQSFVNAFMLEGTNYIQHYGLYRKKDHNGIYEGLSPKHSWNCPHLISNLALFRLPRHSDHHMFVYKPY